MEFFSLLFEVQHCSYLQTNGIIQARSNTTKSYSNKVSGGFLSVRAVFLHNPGIFLEGTSLSSTACTSSEGFPGREQECKGESSSWRNFSYSLWKLDTWVLEIIFPPLQPGTAEAEELLREYLHHQHCSAESGYSLNEKHKGLSIILLPYSISTNLTPAISGCHKTPALRKVRKELKSKGSQNWRKFQTWLMSALCLWWTFPPDTTPWHSVGFVSVWERLLMYVLNIVQILGN